MSRDFSRALYHSKEWGMVRDYCLKRDRYMCRLCNVNPAEEVHHIIHLSPQNIHDTSVTLNPDNLISLCRACHFEQHRGQHGRGRQIEESYPYTFDELGNLVEKKINSPRSEK